MSTFLVTWNPAKWPWDPAHYAGIVAATAEGKEVPGGWAVGGRRQGIVPGDRVFLLRQGTERGIIGSGMFTSEIFQEPHWDGSPHSANYADFDWDVLVDTDDRLPIEELKTKVQPFYWTRVQGSGVEVPSPVDETLEALWREHLGRDTFRYPEEVTGAPYPEGAVRRVEVNRYERDPAARAACIDHWGHACTVCGFDFGAVYGKLGRDFIHVHHLRELSTVGPNYTADAVTDLRPVCPNCHAMLHQRRPALTPNELRKRLKSR